MSRYGFLMRLFYPSDVKRWESEDREFEIMDRNEKIALAVKDKLTCVVCGQLNINGNHIEALHGVKLKLNKKRKREEK